MTMNKGGRGLKSVLGVLAVLSALSLGACGDDKTTIIQGGSGELGDVQASPGVLSFEHVIGRSPCPQLVGDFLVTNTTTSQKTVTFRVSAGAPLLVPTGTALAGGGAQNVPVIFNCTRTTSFEAIVSVEVDGVQQRTVTIRGTVHP
jgi:hypothetical protein